MQGMLEVLLQVYLIFWGRADCSALMGPALHLDMLVQSDCRDLRMWPHGSRASLLDRSAHCTVTNIVMPACAVLLSAPEVLWLMDTLLYLQGHASAGPPPAAPSAPSAVHQPAAAAAQPASTGAGAALVQEYDRLTQPALAAVVQAAAPLQPEVCTLTAVL